MLFVPGQTDNDVVIFGKLRFWAERGLIHIEDASDNSYVTIAVRTALERASAISDMLCNTSKRQKHSHDKFDEMLIKHNRDMIDGIVKIAQKARIQGTPDDPSAVRDLQRRAKRSIVVPERRSSW